MDLKSKGSLSYARALSSYTLHLHTACLWIRITPPNAQGRKWLHQHGCPLYCKTMVVMEAAMFRDYFLVTPKILVNSQTVWSEDPEGYWRSTVVRQWFFQTMMDEWMAAVDYYTVWGFCLKNKNLCTIKRGCQKNTQRVNNDA